MSKRIVERAVQPVVMRVIEPPAEKGIFAGVDLRVDPDRDDLRIMNGANIRELQKISGDLANPKQTASSRQPFYADNYINALGVAQTTANDEKLESLNTVSSGAHDSSFVSQFLFQYDDPNFSTGEPFICLYEFRRNLIWNQHQYYLTLRKSDKKLISVELDGSVNPLISSISLNVGTPYIITIIYELGVRHVLRINGIEVATTSVGTRTDSVSHDMFFLNHNTVNLATAGFNMGELFHNRRILPSQALIEARETYLMNRYGIS